MVTALAPAMAPETVTALAPALVMVPEMVASPPG